MVVFGFKDEVLEAREEAGLIIWERILLVSLI